MLNKTQKFSGGRLSIYFLKLNDLFNDKVSVLLSALLTKMG